MTDRQLEWHFGHLRNTIDVYNDIDDISLFEDRLKNSLSKGYPVNYRSPNWGATLLEHALIQLPIAFPSDWDERSKEQSKRLHSAISLLLDNGADVNIKGIWGGATFLIQMSKYGKSYYTEDLWDRVISLTEDLNARDDNNYSAIDHLAKQYLQTFNFPEDRATYASKGEYFRSVINMLLDKDVEVDIEKYKNEAARPFYSRQGVLVDLKFKQEVADELISHITHYQEQKKQLAPTIGDISWEYEL